ncbi:NADH oxidase [Russula ochroleuca]|uniref:NADH oxidase n=1 Tax=Russula ochroleuca TaxID=152965 RepID=A0A9P5JVF3_9AGAM|nr:NADH oxidase [Russula ochroleuca]
MCQYSSDYGHATDWHLVDIGGFATRGAGGINMEATAVIAPLKRIVDFADTQAAKVGIQLAHAGRKLSTLATWVKSSVDRTRHVDTSVAFANEGGWPDNVFGPVNVPWSKGFPTLKEMTEGDLQYVGDAFIAATKRSISAGCEDKRGCKLVPFAEAVKKAHPDIVVGAVGMITTPQQANDILAEGKADLVSRARELLRDPQFVLRAANELGVAVKPAVQYKRAWPGVLARM